VAYESHFGCTKAIAEAIADGLRSSLTPRVVPINDAHHHHLGDYDLLVLGARTYERSMSRPSARESAERAARSRSLREWLDEMGLWTGHPAAAFGTRLPGPQAMTSRISTGIASELRRHGFLLVTDPLSCLVNRDHELLPAETQRASAWAASLAAALNRAVGTGAIESRM
jgi:hypothetical protein